MPVLLLALTLALTPLLAACQADRRSATGGSPAGDGPAGEGEGEGGRPPVEGEGEAGGEGEGEGEGAAEGEGEGPGEGEGEGEGEPPCVPAPDGVETCNDRDDDCNGLVDDVPGVGEVCGADAGACVAGVSACGEDGQVVCAGAVGPVEETCSGLDDDCDGQTDEAPADGPGLCDDDDLCTTDSCTGEGGCLHEVLPGFECSGREGFSEGLLGWVVEGSCAPETIVIQDDDLHGQTLGLYLSGGGGCSPTTVWAVFTRIPERGGDLRLRLDVKPMDYHGYTGPVYARVYAGGPPGYDDVRLGEHSFGPGGPADDRALDGATTVPVGTWYAWTSDDLLDRVPAGAEGLRVELSVPGGGVYGWARVDNVTFVRDDPAVPTAEAERVPLEDGGQFDGQLAGRCLDGDGGCVGLAWDLGDGPRAHDEAGGGTTSVESPVRFTWPGPGTWYASLTAEDRHGAARSALVEVTLVNLPPEVEIVALPAAGPAPLQVELEAEGADPDGQIVAWHWDFGDGQESDEEAPVHEFARPGTYEVTLTVTDDGGAWATATFVVIVHGPAGLTNGGFEDGLDGWVLEGSCQGEAHTIQDDAVHGTAFGLYLSGGGGCTTTRLWQVLPVPSGQLASARLRVDVKPVEYHGYRGPVYATVLAGGAPDYADVEVGRHSFAPGELATDNELAGATSAPLGTWYAWTSEDFLPDVPGDAAGLRVELTVPGRGVYGWARIDNVRLVTDHDVDLDPSAAAQPARGNPPLDVDFSGDCWDLDVDCPGPGWWDFGDGPRTYQEAGGGGTAAGYAPAYTYAEAGTFVASFTAEDEGGAARSALVTVESVNEPPTVAILADPPVGPAPLAVRLEADASDPDGEVVAWRWELGDGEESDEPAPEHVWAEAGTYLVRVTVTDDDGATASASHAIVVAGDAPLANGGFERGRAGWVLEGSCHETREIEDDAVHGPVFGLYLSGGGGCTPTRLWQVAPLAPAGLAGLRLRVDAKMMDYHEYRGPVYATVRAGGPPLYDAAEIGTHVFAPGELAEMLSLVGTTTVPVGTWYALTTDDFLAAVPEGATGLRLDLWVEGRGRYGWARVDNVAFLTAPGARPEPHAEAQPVRGSAPLGVDFLGECLDADNDCQRLWWDLGDGTIDWQVPGGGSTSREPHVDFVYESVGLFHASLTVEDASGAAASHLVTIDVDNFRPTVEARADPLQGRRPLRVEFSADAQDVDGHIAAWEWQFGDGELSDEEAPVHVYDEAGTWLARVTVTDDVGASASDQVTVVVLE